MKLGKVIYLDGIDEVSPEMFQLSCRANKVNGSYLVRRSFILGVDRSIRYPAAGIAA
jgi:hypothetical protein